YFTLEPVDIINLSNPKEEIIDKGGHIFFVRHEGEIVGTAALIKLSDDTYEFTKMGVTARMQGMGFGRKLSEYCIKKAKDLGAKHLILYSSTRLERAITLYKKLGFREVPLDISDYQRADIKMELQFKV
ncbi:MAG: GNAT family N-acetyltransferase, partial [Thermodesulfobacteriota bacterium]